MNSQDEDGIDSEKDESMNSYSLSIRLQTPEIHILCQASRVAFGIWEPETVVKSTRKAVCVIFLGR
ncbi:hypothetical protein NC653_003442 [Populus alba x Populus x berolinensis]|uniref:Uncharacterized protein n=1 Tax=Populus alba x Populus x berolinensis TaxID=444605 RepID=A0AAD6WJ53_9ROSI|nr:hypothetical protein NC653_003442 [Populus alba x Populus x berolinensis]